MLSITPTPSLCESCRWLRVVTSARGSRFLLCERSFTEPEYPKYPRQPVVRCAGYEAAAVSSEPTIDGRNPASPFPRKESGEDK